MTKMLGFEEVRFASPEPIDANGRVFYWNDSVYRAISQHKAPFYRKLLDDGRAEGLFAEGLVRTEVSDLSLQGYDLVLKHERIPFISYATEWSGSMLKDAALLTLDLSLRLDEQGLELQDAHPWNILFDGTEPKYVDFSSIEPAQGSARWRGLHEFIGTFLNPLVLMAAGEARHARALLVDAHTLRGRRVSRADVARVLLRNKRLKPLAAFLLRPAPSNGRDRRSTLLGLREVVAQIDIPYQKTRWSDYCDEEVDDATIDSWMVKRRVTFEVLKRCQPPTLLDIGSNAGWFSKLAAKNGARVVAFDVDEPSINKLYRNEEARRLRVLPLAMDFRAPTPAYGAGLRCEPAVDRFRSDMVLALAIVHHLVFSQKVTFSEIATSLASFSRRWLLVEFIPKEDVHVAKMYDDSFSWYTLDRFIEELKRHFSTVEVLPSNPDPRVLLLCER